MSESQLAYEEPEKIQSIDSEFLSGKRYAYQEDISLVENVDLDAATPGDDINWLEDIELLSEDGTPAVFDRYSNSFIKIHFAIPAGRENEIARKVLITHLQSGNSYGIQLKEKHCKFPQPELGPWVAGSKTVGADWKPPVLEGWEAPAALNVLVLQHIACEPPGVSTRTCSSSAARRFTASSSTRASRCRTGRGSTRSSRWAAR